MFDPVEPAGPVGPTEPLPPPPPLLQQPDGVVLEFHLGIYIKLAYKKIALSYYINVCYICHLLVYTSFQISSRHLRLLDEKHVKRSKPLSVGSFYR